MFRLNFDSIYSKSVKPYRACIQGKLLRSSLDYRNVERLRWKYARSRDVINKFEGTGALTVSVCQNVELVTTKIVVCLSRVFNQIFKMPSPGCCDQTKGKYLNNCLKQKTFSYVYYTFCNKNCLNGQNFLVLPNLSQVSKKRSKLRKKFLVIPTSFKKIFVNLSEFFQTFASQARLFFFFFYSIATNFNNSWIFLIIPIFFRNMLKAITSMITKYLLRDKNELWCLHIK